MRAASVWVAALRVFVDGPDKGEPIINVGEGPEEPFVGNGLCVGVQGSRIPRVAA